MGLFGSLFGRKQPKPGEALPLPVAMRDTLFGDAPLEKWGPDKPDADANSPWNAFIEARAHLKKGDKDAAIACWRRITERTGLEPRHYVQAWHFLRAQGVQPSAQRAKQILGVVVEYMMPDGLDIVAAYPDNAARYYHHSGKSVIWEHPDNSLNKIIGDLITAGARIVGKIGPSEDARPAAPPLGQVRLSFLTPSGLHYGQGGYNTFSADPMGGPVVKLAVGLMTALMEKTEKK